MSHRSGKGTGLAEGEHRLGEGGHGGERGYIGWEGGFTMNLQFL